MSNNFSYRVYYEDTDAGGVVYYANYLKFFERARTDFLRSLGISQQKLIEEENLAFVVRKCEIEFQKPAKLDDELDISIKILETGLASITMLQEAKRDGEILATLNVKIAFVTADSFKPTKLTNNIKELINNV